MIVDDIVVRVAAMKIIISQLEYKFHISLYVVSDGKHTRSVQR